MKYNDLTVKNGRLINTRPNDVTGIQQAVQIKKELKRAEKIATMSEAMFQAEMKADLVESLRESRMKDDD
jgi:3-dehydroquinate dehydratase